MKVFISWSGRQSLAVARALHDWLPETLQAINPWISKEDIRVGARWTPEINRELSQIKFGIICLTRENQHAPWVLFEAGALAKTLEDTHVVPYLIDLEKSDIEGPLAQFQATQKLGKEGTFELVKSLNEAVKRLDEGALNEKALERVFDRGWPDLEEAFRAIPEAESPKAPSRNSEDILREILDLVRGLTRQANRSSMSVGRDLEFWQQALQQRLLTTSELARRRELEEALRYDLAMTEQQQRVRKIVQRETGEDCPDLVVLRANAVLGGGLVHYRCGESGPSGSLNLSPEDARYVGIDMSVRDRPETGI